MNKINGYVLYYTITITLIVLGFTWTTQYDKQFIDNPQYSSFQYAFIRQ